MPKFSPAYIAFILSDEASVLQGQWKPKQWDHVWADDGNLIAKPTQHGVVMHVFEEDTALLMVKLDDLAAGGFRKDEHLTWLPTLTDLLDMIEEAGYWWTTRLDYDGDDKWYTVSAGNIEAGGRIENDHEDLMVAAATLAVRVVKGG